MFYYSDGGPRSEFKGDVWKMDGSKHYLTHFDNFLFLNVLAKEGTFAEKQQAEKELIICQRKMTFWEQHPNYDNSVVAPIKEQKVNDWKGRA